MLTQNRAIYVMLWIGVLGMLSSISERRCSESNKVTREEIDWIYSWKKSVYERLEWGAMGCLIDWFGMFTCDLYDKFLIC